MSGSEGHKAWSLLTNTTGDLQLRPGDHVHTWGFVHMDTPGYDPVSVTGQVASGTPTRSERHGSGEEEFNPWILGATL